MDYWTCLPAVVVSPKTKYAPVTAGRHCYKLSSERKGGEKIVYFTREAPKGVCIDLRTNHCQCVQVLQKKGNAEGDYSWAYTVGGLRANWVRLLRRQPLKGFTEGATIRLGNNALLINWHGRQNINCLGSDKIKNGFKPWLNHWVLLSAPEEEPPMCQMDSLSCLFTFLPAPTFPWWVMFALMHV